MMTKSINILIIDDCVDDIELYTRHLERCEAVSYSLEFSKNGNDGIEKALSNAFDCILLDYSLPGNDGLQVLSQLKEVVPNTPIIMLTGQGSERLAVQLMQAGANDYINKALVDSKLLHNTISDAIIKNKYNNSHANEIAPPDLIMIVDDNEDDREFCIRSLNKIENTTYRYTEAISCDDAFEKLKLLTPDCVLLDYSLPGHNGIETLQKIKALYPFLSVVIMTGQGSEKIAVEAIKNGAQHYLVKSDLKPDLLYNTIQSAIEQGKMEKRIAEKDQKILESEDQLATSKRFLELILDNNPDLIFVKNEDFKIIECNKAFMALYPKEKHNKIIGYTTVEDYNKDEANAFLEMDKIAFEKGHSETKEKITFPSGQVKILHTRKIRFEDNAQNQFILGIGRDITKTEELIDKLVESNSELEKFAYVASHDLQEPLRMVSNFTVLLEKRLEGKLDDECKKYMEICVSSGKRMQALVKDLLEYSKCAEDNENMDEIDLNQTVKYAEENLTDQIKSCNAQIVYNDLPNITANPVRLLRVLQNLIGNGIKYQKKDTTPVVKISVKEKDDRWEFCIADNGIGINPEYTKQIFLPFKRLHHKEEYDGTGIGLAICAKIINKMGGQVWVESELDKGSNFYFTIPKKLEKTLKLEESQVV